MGLAVGQPVPPALAEAQVLDGAGAPVRLGVAWADRDAVVLFVRHFACAGCSEHVADLRPRLDELAGLGVAVVIVGNGSPVQLAAFVEREQLAHPAVACFTDPPRRSYAAAGLVRSRWGTVGPVALAQLARLFLHGHRNGRPQGDLHQQGGTLYVRKGGVVAFHHRAASLGEHAPLVDIVEVALAERAGEAAGG